MAYQPIVRLDDGPVGGLEALARLDGAGGEPIPPAELIPLAEDLGLISAVGRRVLRETCELAVTVGNARPSRASISVNLSASGLAQPELAPIVAGILADCGLDPDRLASR